MFEVNDIKSLRYGLRDHKGLHIMQDDSNTTACGVDLGEPKWPNSTKGYRPCLTDIIPMSGKVDLYNKFTVIGKNKPKDKTDYCEACIAKIPHREQTHWNEVLDHEWLKKTDTRLCNMYDELLIGQLPKNHVVGWIVIKLKPHKYTFTPDTLVKSYGRYGTHETSIRGKPKTRWRPSRSVHSEMFISPIEAAGDLSKKLMSMKDEKLKDENVVSVELDFHATEDIFFLCSKNDSGALSFCDFMSFKPPLNGKNLEIFDLETSKSVFHLEIYKPTLQALNDDEA